MEHRTSSTTGASDALRRAVAAVSMRPVPGVVSPDPGRLPRGPFSSPTAPVGFRSTQDVVSEMSPVIYRPGGGKPERQPDRRGRRASTDAPPPTPAPPSIAPPSVPTASTYVEPQRPPVGRYDGFDDDLDITDDELDAAADDAVLDQLDAVAPRHLDASGLDAPAEAPAPERPVFEADGPAVAPPAREPRTKQRLASDEHAPESPGRLEPAPTPAAAAPVAPSGPPRYSVPKPRYAARPTPSDPTPVEAPSIDEPLDLLPEPELTPAPEPVVEPEPVAEVPAPPVVMEARRPRVRTLHISAPPVGPGEPIEAEPSADQAVVDELAPTAPAHRAEHPDDELAEYAPHEDVVEGVDVVDEAPDAEITEPVDLTPAPDRAGPAITGRVTSTRGRGLSGITVSLVDRAEEVVASVGTSRHGEYVFDEVANGVYRLAVSDDIDGDFAGSWYGSDDVDTAEPIEISDDGIALRGVDVAMRSAVTLETEVDVRKRKVVLDVLVTDNATGLPAVGTVQVTTDLFSAALPLTKGRTSISLLGSTTEWGAGVPRLSKRARIEFLGGKHSAPVTRTVKLR